MVVQWHVPLRKVRQGWTISGYMMNTDTKALVDFLGFCYLCCNNLKPDTHQAHYLYESVKKHAYIIQHLWQSSHGLYNI